MFYYEAGRKELVRFIVTAAVYHTCLLDQKLK